MKKADTDKNTITGGFPNRGQTVIALTGTLLYAMLVCYTARFHEPWFDEAQSWLLVRDMGLWNLLVHGLRYEGHPSLWYLLLWLPTHLGMPYRFLPFVSAGIAVFTAWLILRYAPFPAFIRWMIPFGYFFVFQYAIIARSYVLIPLILSAMAILYKKRLKRPILFLCMVTLLMHTSLHGAVIAVGLGLAECVNAIRWPDRDVRRHRWFSRWFLIVLAVNSLLLSLQLSFPKGLIYTMGPVKKNFPGIVNGAITDIGIFSAVFFLVFMVWLYRQGYFLTFLFPFAGLMAVFSRVYKIWHGGIVFVLLVFVLWIAYPSEKNDNIGISLPDRLLRDVFLVAFGCTLSVQVLWGAREIRYDIKTPFSGSKSCARVLKRKGLDRGGLYMVGYNSVGVQPYFGKNIFVNNAAPNHGAFWFWSEKNPLARDMLTADHDKRLLGDLKRRRPAFILVGVFNTDSLLTLNRIVKETDYRIQGEFKGTTGWKGKAYEPDDLYLLGRHE